MPFYIVEIRNQHAVRDQVDLIMADQGFVPKLGRDHDDFNHLTYEGESLLAADRFTGGIQQQLKETLQHDIEVSVVTADGPALQPLRS